MQEQRYAFGPFVLDIGRRALVRSGEAVAMPSRPFEILRVLVERRDRVVPRSEIMAEVWPGLAVDDHNLPVQMSKLRRILGPASDGWIATVPGRGYQFTAPVLPVAAEPVPALPAGTGQSKRRRANVLVGVLAAPVVALAAFLAARDGGAGRLAPVPAAAMPSLMVLPWRDETDGPGHHYLADAITDDLTTELARLPQTVVLARETARGAGGLAPAEIGRRYGVRYLLGGTIRVEPAGVHVDASLTDTADGALLWVDRSDIPLAELGDARAAIVGRTASVLDRQIPRIEAARAARDRPDDPTAVDLFFRARSALDADDTLASYDAAQRLFERAIAARPDFADAEAELGAMLLRKLRSTDDPASAADRAEADRAIGRALALSPDNVTALGALAHADYIDGRTDAARSAAELALRVDPNDVAAREVLEGCFTARGDIDRAAEALAAVLRIDPAGASWHERELRLGYLRLLQGRMPEAEDWLSRSIADEPGGLEGQGGREEGARLLLIAAARLAGRPDEAAARFQSYDRSWPHRSTWRFAALVPRAVSRLPGFHRLLDALREAGMTAHADEHEDDGVAPGATELPSSQFGPTPLALTGARTIDTAALARLATGPKPPVILDAGPGVALPPGATWQDGRPVATALRARRDVGAADPIVVMGDGTFGSASYDEAFELVRSGYRNVLWYRGGEEAWAAAGLPASDVRP